MNMNKEVMVLNLKDVLPNRFQPRIIFDEKAISELAESIKEHGVIQPIVVRKIADKYEIIAGERRYKASLLAGKTTIPAIVTDLNDKDSAEIALIENVQRSDLTPIEEAISYKKILDMGYLSQSDLATKLGKTQSTVANKLRLLNLSEEVQEELLRGRISERHARSLLKLEEQEQEQMVKRIIEERMTVRKTDEEIEKLLNKDSILVKSIQNIDKEEKRLVKYIVDEEEEGKNMENNEIMGSYNIPTTPIVDLPEEKVVQNINPFEKAENTFMKESQKKEVQPTINMETNNPFSPITAVEPIESINMNSQSPSSDPVIFSTGLAESKDIPVVNPVIEQSIETPTSTEISNPFENNPLINNSVSTAQSNINTVNQTNVDPTNPEPVTNGKFFNMFSEMEEDNTMPLETVNLNQINSFEVPTTPVVEQQVANVSTNISDTPDLFNSNLFQGTNDIEGNITSINQSASIENINPFPSVSSVQKTNMETPVADINQPVSIDTVQPIKENNEPIVEDVNMTPLQTYRLNDNQTFENSSVVELGSFGGGRMEEAVLQPLKVEQNTAPRASMKEVINTIRDCAKTIESFGYIIDTDEIDFEDNYQVTFRIEKNEQ